jgi:hypothetical protein
MSLPHPRSRGVLLGVVFLLIGSLLSTGSSLRAQIAPESKAISIGYGLIDGDYSLSMRLSAPIRLDMGVEVVGEFVPARNGLSDLYTLVLFQYFFQPEKRIVPNVSGGAGAVTIVGGGRRMTDFGIGFGGGVRVYLLEGLAVRLDVEHYTLFPENESENRPGAAIAALFDF